MKGPISASVRTQKQPKYLADVRTVEGLLSQKASRQMLQASSQASCTPPSTNAAAEDSLLSIFAFSSISAARYPNRFLRLALVPHTCILGEISYSQGKAKRRRLERTRAIQNPPLHATNLARNGNQRRRIEAARPGETERLGGSGRVPGPACPPRDATKRHENDGILGGNRGSFHSATERRRRAGNVALAPGTGAVGDGERRR